MRRWLLLASLCSFSVMAKTDNCSPAEHSQIRQQATELCVQKLSNISERRSIDCELRMVTPSYCQSRCVRDDGRLVRVTSDLTSRCIGGIPSVRLGRTIIRTTSEVR